MNYRIEHKPAFKVVGKSTVTSTKNNTIPEFWSKCTQDYTIEKMCKFGGGDIMGTALLGICYGTMETDEFNYMVAFETKCDDVAGFESMTVLESEWAIFESIGAMPYAIQNVWKEAYDLLGKEDFPYRHAMTPDMEVYYEGDNSKPDYKCEVWIPVVKK